MSIQPGKWTPGVAALIQKHLPGCLRVSSVQVRPSFPVIGERDIRLHRDHLLKFAFRFLVVAHPKVGPSETLHGARIARIDFNGPLIIRQRRVPFASSQLNSTQRSEDRRSAFLRFAKLHKGALIVMMNEEVVAGKRGIRLGLFGS